MKLKFKRLNSNAVIPTKAHPNDVGWDLTAITETITNEKSYGYLEYDTGIAVTPPEGYYCQIVPRSSISKTGLWLTNSMGVIDPGYTGSIKARFKWVPGTEKYKVGDRIAQLIVAPIVNVELEEVDALKETERAEAGFGSTGS